MKNCHHQNIVRLIEEFETEEEIYLVLEYVKVGDCLRCCRIFLWIENLSQ